MAIKRTFSWTWTSLGRIFSCRRCSLWKILTVILSAFFTWAALVLIDATNMLHYIKRGVPADILYRPQNLDQQTSDFGARWASDLGPPLVDDSLSEESPQGAYFNNVPKPQAQREIPVMVEAKTISLSKDTLNSVLVFVKDLKSPSVMEIDQFFSQQRIKCSFTEVYGELPSLILKDSSMARYALLVFDDYVTYLSMDLSKKAVLDDYCKTYGVSILGLTQSATIGEIQYFPDVGFKFQHNMKLREYKLNSGAKIWRVAKPEEIFKDDLPSSDWTIFISNHETYYPLAHSTVASDWRGTTTDISYAEFDCVIAVYDQGLLDGIQRIILGHDVTFWINTIVAMDAITYLTNGRLGLTLDRLLQIDVDDMFVGKQGIRTLKEDAEAMVASQEKIRRIVQGFTYVLGFSGGMYMVGNDREIEGDKRILQLQNKFLWFDHMYRHEQPHTLSPEKLHLSMSKNLEFAKEHNLTMLMDYMVTPHHSGVYPVYEPIYDEWKERGVTCTSTEEYPRHLPHWGRRGFIYRDVKVVPRQTCRLFTHTVMFEDYQGGKTELDNSIRGGYLFKLFLQIPVMIFMTHMSNYANDRLAQYSFENVIEFIVKWTNLRILGPPPSEIARRYFAMYPLEVMPFWTNPCDYSKHMEIWPANKSCENFPKFIIVGPQKTGTTALHTFLEVHPSLVTSNQDPTYFEEVQFFNSKNYVNGLDWYQNHFPVPKDKQTILFEKSANYFDNEGTPKRIFALLPNAKIIIILAEPGRRAYSWYQHLRSHKDPVAMNYTFFEVVSAPESGPRFLKDTRNRCLKPGLYAVHLAKWLQFFPENQIFLIDGDQLNRDPVTVLNNLQKFIKVQPFLDYSTVLSYNPEKGFYCVAETGCLSSSKGRKYSSMDPESKRFLDSYYKEPNEVLKTLLRDMGQPYPQWLNEPPL